MSKLLAGVIAALIVGAGVAAASSLSAGGDRTPTSTIATTDSMDTTETTRTPDTTETTQTGVDISGPCDEAEHANDPRCTGAATTAADDDDDNDDDRSNDRGNRGGDDDDDHRGHGSGGEDRSGSDD